MSKQKIKVVIVDDHEILREGLDLLLQDEEIIQVVGKAANGYDAINMVQELQPDVILMDIVMDGPNGLETSQVILQDDPDARIIILTMYSEQAFLEKAISIGAKGFFLKGSDSQKLVEVIHRVYDGNTSLDLVLPS